MPRTYGAFPAEPTPKPCHLCQSSFHPPRGQPHVILCHPCFMANLPRIRESVRKATRGTQMDDRDADLSDLVAPAIILTLAAAAFLTWRFLA